VAKLEKYLTNNGRLSKGSPQAGVLVPLFRRDNKSFLLLTQRSSDLRKHSGQISFPGGKLENIDDSIIDTALRETYEEIGIPPQQVSIIGKFNDFSTPYYRCVTPVLAVIEPQDEYQIQEAEIDHVIEVPLEDLLDPTIHHTEQWEFEGNYYTIHFYSWAGNGAQYEIWGATAGVIAQLLQILQP